MTPGIDLEPNEPANLNSTPLQELYQGEIVRRYGQRYQPLLKEGDNILQRDVAAPGNLADHASGPKIQRLANPKNGLANVAALAGRLDFPPLHSTPECHSAAVPGRMFLEFLLRPLGVNRIDANFHEVVQGLAGCAFAKEEHEFIVTGEARRSIPGKAA